MRQAPVAAQEPARRLGRSVGFMHFLLWIRWWKGAFLPLLLPATISKNGKWLAKIIKIAMERPTFYSSMIKGTGYDGTSSFVHELSRVFEIHQTKLISSIWLIMTSDSTNLSLINCQRLKGIIKKKKTWETHRFGGFVLNHIHEISNPQVPLLGSRRFATPLFAMPSIFEGWGISYIAFKLSKYLVFTLPETNSSPLKIDPWKRRFLLETTIFRCYVSFREGKLLFRLQ